MFSIIVCDSFIDSYNLITWNIFYEFFIEKKITFKLFDAVADSKLEKAFTQRLIKSVKGLFYTHRLIYFVKKKITFRLILIIKCLSD